MLLTNSPIGPTLPTTDLERSKKFYTEMLGLVIKKQSKGGILYEAGNGTMLYVYKRPPSPAAHTLASFRVDNLEQTVDELAAKGVVFEHYDFPGLKTDAKGIALSEEEGEKAAWFKDPDGNILSVGQEL